MNARIKISNLLYVILGSRVEERAAPDVNTIFFELFTK